jgi:hypothetical protein
MCGLKAATRFAALTLMFVGACAACAQDSQSGDVQTSGDAVIFNGQINAASVAKFVRALQDSAIKRLVITSRGGSVAAALDMADAVHERQLDIEVPATCLSSCANYVFPAAQNKVLGRPGAVAWHGNMAHVLFLQQSGQGSWSESEMQSARELAIRESEFFRVIGVDGFVCWFAKIEPYNVDDFYFLSPGDMERFGIRNVTLRDQSALTPDSQELHKVVVDWPSLETRRPVVKLGK